MTMSINGTNGLTFNDASTQNTAATGFGFKNRIINGAMVIDQRNSGAAVTPSAAAQYTIDRFVCVGTQASKLTYQQVTDAPAGFANSIKVLTAVAATPAAGDQFRFGQCIEGFNCADLGWGTASAKTATVSFWAKASIAGTYSVGLWNNGTNNYSYVSTVSLTTAWAQYSITITGPTTGTWGTGNSGCIDLIFDLGAGSNWTTSTLNAWQSGGAPGYFKATGSVSLVSNAAATLQITGVQLEKGSTATAFDYRPYGTELMLCQRYYQVLADNSRLSGMAFNASVNPMSWVFGVQMRATPTTIALSGVGTSTVLCGGSNLPLTSISNAGGSPSGVFFDANTGGGGTAGFGTQLRLVGSTISAAAEL